MGCGTHVEQATPEYWRNPLSEGGTHLAEEYRVDHGKQPPFRLTCGLTGKATDVGPLNGGEPKLPIRSCCSAEISDGCTSLFVRVIDSGRWMVIRDDAG